MSVIGDVLPAAVALALVNPLPVVATILLLLAPRGATSAASFLVGWVVGLASVLALLVFVVPIERLVGDESAPTVLASVVLLALGAALLIAAFRKWRSRPGSGDDPSTPGWMRSLAEANPLAAFGLGLLLSAVNPKNAAFIVAAATAIGEGNLATGAKFSSLVVFVVAGSCGVALPVAWSAVGGANALASLERWRTWLTANYAVMMTVVFFYFGVTLVSKGLEGLFG